MGILVPSAEQGATFHWRIADRSITDQRNDRTTLGYRVSLVCCRFYPHSGWKWIAHGDTEARRSELLVAGTDAWDRP